MKLHDVNGNCVELGGNVSMAWKLSAADVKRWRNADKNRRKESNQRDEMYQVQLG